MKTFRIKAWSLKEKNRWLRNKVNKRAPVVVFTRKDAEREARNHGFLNPSDFKPVRVTVTIREEK